MLPPTERRINVMVARQQRLKSVVFAGRAIDVQL
jgi:hypothetical protein